MKIRALSIEGAYEITPVQHGDPRGSFAECYRLDLFAAEIGHPLRIAQINMSISARGVVRGIHFADVPPGQAKYVTCPRGAAGRRRRRPAGRARRRSAGGRACVLDDVDRRAVYIGEGLGHGFCALTDDATLIPTCAPTPYNPQREHADPPARPGAGHRLAGVDDPVLSARDARRAVAGRGARPTGCCPTTPRALAYRDVAVGVRENTRA